MVFRQPLNPLLVAYMRRRLVLYPDLAISSSPSAARSSARFSSLSSLEKPNRVVRGLVWPRVLSRRGRARVPGRGVSRRRRRQGSRPPSPKSTARSDPTPSSTARRSSARMSKSGVPPDRSDRPVPRLSKRITRENAAVVRGTERPRGARTRSRNSPHPDDVDEVDRPVAAHLVRDVHAIDGLRVLGLGDVHARILCLTGSRRPGAGPKKGCRVTEVMVNGRDDVYGRRGGPD